MSDAFCEQVRKAVAVPPKIYGNQWKTEPGLEATTLEAK